MEPKTRNRLLITFQNRQAFLANLVEEQEGPGGIVVGIHEDIRVGEIIDLEIAFADELMLFRLQVKVRQKLIAHKPPSMRLDFLAADDGGRMVLIQYVKGTGPSTIRRRPRRFPVSLPVEYATEEEFVRATTEDMSRFGAFLLSEQLLDAGTLLALRIHPPGESPFVVNAEVAWQRKTEPIGFGVVFLIGDPQKQKKINDLVGHLSNYEV